MGEPSPGADVAVGSKERRSFVAQHIELARSLCNPTRCGRACARWSRSAAYRPCPCTGSLRPQAAQGCMLPPSATCCNPVQHAATQCSMLQDTATCCHPVQHVARHCNMLQDTATCCKTLQHGRVLQHGRDVPCRRSASSGSTRMASCRVVRASRQPSPTSSRSGAGTRAEHSREALHPHMRSPGADVAAPAETARPHVCTGTARALLGAHSTRFRLTFVPCTHARTHADTRSRPSRPCTDGRAPNSASAGGWCVSAIRETSYRNDAHSPFHSGAHRER